MEHSELVAEMAHVERLSTQERLHLARRRRLQQLKVWSHREKEWLRMHKQQRTNNANRRNGHRRVYFSNSVMLLEAASRNDIDEVRRLLMSGVDPDSTNEDGLTALHQCCIDDNEEMMKLLIEFGANPNAEDSEKWTPLHAAATCAHLHLVRYLIFKGANLLAVNADGNMPYDICEDEAALDYIEGEMARRGVTQELIDETRAATETTMLRDLQELSSMGMDLEVSDTQGATPLHIAAANGYLRVVEFLLDNNVSTDVRDCDDWQPVHAAACWGHMDVLELLVQNGADLTARTKHDETPADICEDAELRERITLLRTEQEQSRRMQEQKRKVRRTQSNNTRTQSVRRTSIREKGLVQKKDAQEEARLRLTLAPPATPTGAPAAGAAAPVTQDINGDLESPAIIDNIEAETLQNVNPPNWDRREPEGKDKDDVNGQYENNNNPPLSIIPATSTTTTTSDAYITASDASNGKININVTVTINTLADLKKQRAQIRSGSGRSPRTSLVSSNSCQPVSEVAAIGAAGDVPSATVSPVNKFTGPTTGDVVADVRSRRCCVVM